MKKTESKKNRDAHALCCRVFLYYWPTWEQVTSAEICTEDVEDDEVDDGEQEEDAEEEEESDAEEQPFTEDEEAIIAYLRDDEPLPPDLLQKLLNEWWHQEPFRYLACTYCASVFYIL